MSEAEFAYEFVRQGIWDAEDLRDWMASKCRKVFRYAWDTATKLEKDGNK